jgi:regulatory Fis family protein
MSSSKKKPSDKKDTHARRTAPAKELTVERVKTAIEATGGIKTATALSLGIARSTLYKFLDANPELDECFVEQLESAKDLAEGNVLKAIKAQDMNTTRWFLDRMAKDRGYGNITIGVKNDGDKPLRVATEEAVDYSQLTIEERKQLLALKRKAAVAKPDAVNAAPSK